MALPRVLCVDDDPLVLEGLSLQLRQEFEVVTAPGGVAGLLALQARGPFVVIVCDMRMPVMDGATFLLRAKQTAPETIRILLTGHADFPAAVSAVNKGQIFRFLTKPCEPEDLISAIASGVEQHRLRSAEREVLEQTLMGSIQVLSDILALADPVAFGRANRVLALVRRIARLQDRACPWYLEAAAMLSSLGNVALPSETLDKINKGLPISPREQDMVDRAPTITEDLLAWIPRLEPVREILRLVPCRFDGKGWPDQGSDLSWGAQALKIAIDFDVLEERGNPPTTVLVFLRKRSGSYDPSLLDTLERAAGASAQPAGTHLEISLAQLEVGMIVVQDIRFKNGPLLVARGNVVTSSLIERLKNNVQEAKILGPLRVMLPTPSKGAATQ